MFDTIMFDLDGTLLPLDLNEFLALYFREMGNSFQNIINPQILKSYVLTATEAMVVNLEPKTNETVFMEKFGELIGEHGRPLKLFQEYFTAFYDQGFLKIKTVVADIPIISESISILKQKGYQLVIATNPLFPKKAILHRIDWAGLDQRDFAYITCYEQNHYCKPQLKFYEEVLQVIGKKPDQCLMVGNDVEEDMVAGALGIKTYLVTNYLIHQSPAEIRCTHQGVYQDFYKFAAGLPELSVTK